MYGKNCHLLENSSPMAKGTSVIRRSTSYAAGVSSRMGSSKKSRVPDGIIWQKDAASATLRRWWYSTPITGVRPTASRTFTIHSAIKAMDSRGSNSAGSPSSLAGVANTNRMAGQPPAARRFASSTISGPALAWDVVKHGTQSR